MPASQGPAAASDAPAHLQPVTLHIRGVQIAFPFKPYASQLAMMDRVVQALKHSQNVLLELPTGSGKSLSLLCAACAWQEGEATALRKEFLIKKDGDEGKGPKEGKPPKAPKVYICSRTHSQLEQLVRELRKTPYSPRMCVLGSREQYCINEDVCRPGTGKSKGEGCKEKLEENKCGHFHGVQRLAAHPRLQQPHDIEDMVALGHKLRGCPYFAARQLQQEASIVFCPYNYILDPAVRAAMDIDLAGASVVVDEAHNIEDCCRDAAGLQVSEEQLLEAGLQWETTRVLEGDDGETYQALDAVTRSLASFLRGEVPNLEAQSHLCAQKVSNGHVAAQVFRDAGVSEETLKPLSAFVVKALKALDENKG
ncbi:hypothetical protein T484DRAFT_1652007, partial [Baffinella frigidus]